MSVKTVLMDRIPNYNNLVIPYHKLKAMMMAHKYRFPGKRMRVIGVTGTNGKTSTCFMIWKMLNEAGHKTGLMTTVAWGVDKLEEQIEHMTTVDTETLNQRMQKIAETGAEFLVLEITSHALAQNRIFGVPIEIAVMTNVTHEHLDYHKTFKNYRDAKRKLFKVAKYGVINEDDGSWSYFASDVDEYITYGINGGILKAEKIELAAEGVKYEVKEADEKLKIRTHIPGKFTVYNSLAATAVGLKLGLTKKQIEDGILALVSVEGRMNRVNEGQDFEVLIDYAHTPSSFQVIMPSVRDRVKAKGGRVMTETDERELLPSAEKLLAEGESAIEAQRAERGIAEKNPEKKTGEKKTEEIKGSRADRAEDISVMIINASGIDGAGAEIADTLRAKGFHISSVETGNASDRPKTAVMTADSHVNLFYGMPFPCVIMPVEGTGERQAIVIIGRDYRAHAVHEDGEE